MAINFPNNPNPNDTHSSGGKTWVWDGTSWKLNSTAAAGMALTDLSVTTTSTGTAALSYNNNTGVFTYTPPDLGANTYSLPTASTTVLGGVKIDGSTITINNGVISGASAYNNGDLDARLNTATATSGQILSWTGTDYDWVAESVPTSITVANESTDTTCYPLFSTNTTGNIAPKTLTSFKLNSQTGQVEAGSFKKTGGTSSEFLKADGSIDSTSYLSSYTIPNSGVTAGSYTNSNITVGADGRVTAAASGSAATNIPLGGIIMWYGSTGTIPSGWSLCDGTTVNGYATPNLRDRFVIGAGNSYAVNATGGSTTDTVNISGSDTVNISGSDTVSISGTTGAPVSSNLYGLGDVGGSNKHVHSFSGSATVNISASDTVNISGSDTVNTIPPYYALCYIMRTS